MLLFVLILGGLLVGCGPKTLAPKAYFQFLNDAENGLVRSKVIGDLEMSVKVLPIDYLVHREYNYDATLNPDSIASQYGDAIYFLFNLGPSEEAQFDITRVGLEDYRGYQERAHHLNFEMAEHFRLAHDETTYEPLFVHMESLTGLKKDRNFLMAFPSPSDKGADFCLVYTDQIFMSGINRFCFQGENLLNLPKLMLTP